MKNSPITEIDGKRLCLEAMWREAIIDTVEIAHAVSEAVTTIDDIPSSQDIIEVIKDKLRKLNP